MHYNVPQFIDIEDRIVGPLTVKQLLWLFGLGTALLMLWFVLENRVFFFIVAIPITILFLALAFYRPYSFSLSKFIGSIFLFFVRPKVYVWKRNERSLEEKKLYKKELIAKIENKGMLKQTEIYDISKVLDSEPDILKEINKKD